MAVEDGAFLLPEKRFPARQGRLAFAVLAWERARAIARGMAFVEQRLGHRAVDHAGIEVTIAVMRGQSLAERAFA